MSKNDFEKEIKKIVEYKNSTINSKARKNGAQIDDIVNRIINDSTNGNYNFYKLITVGIKRDGKIRHIRMYPPFSTEEALCVYIKRILDKKLHVDYPNRNDYIHSLFDILNALKNMSDYTILRFDFRDFYNSVSADYVYEKIIKYKRLERYQTSIIEQFVYETKYTYAGLNTSNLICEIIAKQFDQEVSVLSKDLGLIFYRRYIDDGIVIFNRFVPREKCIDLINKAITNTFYDKSIYHKTNCKTSLNNDKTQYISARELLSTAPHLKEFDYLGYLFVLEKKEINNTNFKFGITTKKIEKYSKKIDKLIKEYKSHQDLELLRHQLKAYTHRCVYQITIHNTTIWKTKGFISNYNELKYRLDKLTPETKKFLKSIITVTFKNNGLAVPYFLRGRTYESIYNLYNNLQHNRTLLFVEHIGIGKTKLEKMCAQINSPTKNKEYDDLVRDYLIKVKVGH